jgi:hypothetical protein
MLITEWQQVGNVFTNITSRVIKGVKSVYYTQNVSYSAKEGIFRSFVAYPAGRYITYLAAFETNKKWKGAFVRNFNPDEVTSTWEANIPDPGQMIVTYFTKDGVKYMEFEWHKVSGESISLNLPGNDLPMKEIAASADQAVAGWNRNKHK